MRLAAAESAGGLGTSSKTSLRAPRVAVCASRTTECSRIHPKPAPQTRRRLAEICRLSAKRLVVSPCPAVNPSGQGDADSYEDRGIFGAAEKQQCSLREAQEAREACSVVDPVKRKECYASFGVDAERVESYLDDVLSLEDKLPTGPSIGDVVKRLGGQLLMAFGLGCLMLLELLWNVAVSLYRGAEAMLGLARTLVAFVSRLWRRVRSALSSNQDNCDAGGCFFFDPNEQTFKEASVKTGNEPSQPEPMSRNQ